MRRNFCSARINPAVHQRSRMSPSRQRVTRAVTVRVMLSADCLACDFSGAWLKHAHFYDGRDLRGTSFAGADLTWAILTRCDLRGCNFRGATLSFAYIQEARIDRSTDFRGANLTGLHWQDRKDNSGGLLDRASDWRQGTYDSSTIHD